MRTNFWLLIALVAVVSVVDVEGVCAISPYLTTFRITDAGCEHDLSPLFLWRVDAYDPTTLKAKVIPSGATQQIIAVPKAQRQIPFHVAFMFIFDVDVDGVLQVREYSETSSKFQNTTNQELSKLQQIKFYELEMKHFQIACNIRGISTLPSYISSSLLLDFCALQKIIWSKCFVWSLDAPLSLCVHVSTHRGVRERRARDKKQKMRE